jgi:hypothetical protein
MAMCDNVKELSLNYGVEVVNLCIAAYITFGTFESEECKPGHKGTGQKVIAVIATILMACMLVKNFFLTKSMETAIARSKAEAIAESNTAIAQARADNAQAIAKAVAEAEDRAKADSVQAIAKAVAEAEDRAKADSVQAIAKAVADGTANAKAEFGYGAYSAADFYDIDRAAAVDDPLFDDLESQKEAMKRA